MIALLRGTVLERRPDTLVLLTPGGVGYELGCSTTTLASLPPEGSEIELLCHLVVREDALTLFGFRGAAERDLFLLLVSVQAVGPKMALAVLGGGTPDEIAGRIVAGDVERLQRAPGIGKRTAERIVSELRDRIAASTGPGGDGTGLETPTAVTATDEARDGLLGLGLTAAEAEHALDAAEGDSAAELIADALRRSRA